MDRQAGDKQSQKWRKRGTKTDIQDRKRQRDRDTIEETDRQNDRDTNRHRARKRMKRLTERKRNIKWHWNRKRWGNRGGEIKKQSHWKRGGQREEAMVEKMKNINQNPENVRILNFGLTFSSSYFLYSHWWFHPLSWTKQLLYQSWILIIKIIINELI